MADETSRDDLAATIEASLRVADELRLTDVSISLNDALCALGREGAPPPGLDYAAEARHPEQLLSPAMERWAEALAIERMYGDDARLWVATKIGALALNDDKAGVARFRAIAARLEDLIQGRRT